MLGAGLEGGFEFCTVGAGLNPPPSVLGLWSDAETGGSPMGNRGTEPPRDPGMSKVTTVASTRCSGNFSLSEQHPVLALCLLGGLGFVCGVVHLSKYKQFTQGLTGFSITDPHLRWHLLKPQVLRGEGWQGAHCVCVCVCVCVCECVCESTPAHPQCPGGDLARGG